MGDHWWWGAVGAALVVLGVSVRPRVRGRWRSFVLEIVTLAGWTLVVVFLIRPLVPANVLGIAILVVIALCVLAVPLIARRKAGREGSRERPHRKENVSSSSAPRRASR